MNNLALLKPNIKISKHIKIHKPSIKQTVHYRIKQIFFFIIFFLPILVSGQNIIKYKQIVAGLNNYMEFIHETTHSEYLFRSDFVNFNSELLRKYKYPKSKIFFDNRDHLDEITYYEDLPSVMYKKCLDSKFSIEVGEKANLDSFIEKMWQSIQNMELICDTIEIKVENGVFEDTSRLKEGFELLERAKLEFYNYLTDWYLLKTNIYSIMLKYGLRDTSNPYIKTSIALDNLFNIVYNLAENIRQNDTNNVKKLIPILEETINKFDGKADYYLKGAKRYGYSNGHDPYLRFDKIIEEAKAELSHAQNFVKHTKYPQYLEKTYRKSDYYYNEKIINKFNRHGLGMAYEYNIFAENSNGWVLKKAQLPHTLNVIYPEKPIEKPQRDIIVEYTLIDAPQENLIFLLDVSNSMNSPEKMPLLKESIKYLVSLMRAYDYITIVAFSGTARVVMPATKAIDKDSISKIIDNIYAVGQTKLFPGLKISYSSAKKSFIKEGNNKIILATDGKFKVDKKITKLISKNSDNIQLSVLYFGKSNHNYEELKKLTELGQGNCTKITAKNLKKVLVKEADGKIK